MRKRRRRAGKLIKKKDKTGVVALLKGMYRMFYPCGREMKDGKKTFVG